MDGTPSEPGSSADGGGRLLLGPRPVRVFPSDDLTFRAAVSVAIKDLTNGAAPSRERLEAMLRHHYPAVRVGEQEPFTAEGDWPAVYVFRDGSLLGR